MMFKQPGAFTFAKVDVPGNVFEGNRISVILFNVGKDTLYLSYLVAIYRILMKKWCSKWCTNGLKWT